MATTPTAVSVTTTATKLADSNPSRKCVSVQPTDGTIYYGPSSVTTSNGLPVASGQTLEDAHEKDSVFGIAAAGTVNVRVSEVEG